MINRASNNCCSFCHMLFDLIEPCGCAKCGYCDLKTPCVGKPFFKDNPYSVFHVTPKPPKLVVTSGFFAPLHKGHLSLINASRKLGKRLIVIVNNDKQGQLKGSVPFMCQEDRLEIVANLKAVDEAILAIDEDITVAATLAKIAQDNEDYHIIFAKGGDRSDNSKMPIAELAVTGKYGIELVYGVGGKEKLDSSSSILEKIRKNN